MPKKRGFAAMKPETHKALSSRGGAKAHKLGTAHTWTRAEAKDAGSKGGKASRGGRGRDYEPEGE